MKTSDLTPPLGYPGGPCHLEQRVELNVRNPRVKEQILDTIEYQGHLDKNQERIVYDQHVEQDKRGRIILPPHVQHRMDQRGITVNEVKFAIKEFIISNNPARDQLSRGERVEFKSKKMFNLTLILVQKGRDIMVISAYWKGVPDPGPPGNTCPTTASRLAMAWRLAQKTHVRVPYSHKPVQVMAPKRKRQKWPFQGFIDFQGLKIDVENKAGSKRKGTDPNGEAWEVDMHYHYGEIRGTEGCDGDLLDAYVGPNADSPLVVVVHQQDPETKEYDEDKVMLGFDSVPDALKAYRGQYNKPGFYGSHSALNIGEFWRWCHNKRMRGKKVKKALFGDIQVALV